MRGLIRRVLDWVDQRTGFETAVRNFMYEDIPASSGWPQVLGSVALFLFLVQAFTGILLAFNYAPQPGDAYYSLQYIINDLTAGRIIRGLHHWGASMMVVVVVLHMMQVALWGAYKKPREATWLLGVALLLLVMGFGLTGYLLPWDNRAYWATVVTIQIAGLAPVVGEYMMRLLGSADGSVGVSTFSRFYTVHTLVLPALTALLIALHVHLVRKHGITPQPADASQPKKKFYPQQAFKEVTAIFVAFAILLVMAVALHAPLERLADPTDSTYIPRPDWYFLFLFQTLKFFEGTLEVVGAIVLPTLALIALVVVPFLDRGKAKKLGERTVAFGAVGLAAIAWTSLTVSAIVTTPKQPKKVDTGLAPTADWKQLTPVELAGLSCYRQEKCANCHNLSEGEPKIGPTLATVAERKSADWMIAHFKNPSQLVPGSPMPAIQLSDELLNCLSAFLLKVTPANAPTLEAAPDLPVRGALIYQEKMCSNCHLINGIGMTVGPPLNGVSERRTKDWLIGHFRDPEKYSPGTMMPAFDFPSQQMEAIVAYLSELPAG